MDPLKDDYSLFECRVCQSKDFLMNMFVNESHQIVEKLCFCASIQITENDGLPQHICTTCFSDLLIAYAFRKRCEETDSRLRASSNTWVKIETSQSLQEQEAAVMGIEHIESFGSCNEIKEELLETESDPEVESIIPSHSESFDLELNTAVSCDSSHKQTRPRKKCFTCDTCQAEFSRGPEYFQHIRTHGKQRFQCRTCSKWFSRKKEWERHEARHFGEIARLPCDKCSKDFSSRTSLMRHISDVHERRRRFVCDICKQSFAQSTHLRTHQSVHSGKEHKCTECSQVFKAYRYYLIHRKTHFPQDKRVSKLSQKYKVPPSTYVCSYCGKISKYWASNHIHERTHTGEKPHACTVCSKAFVSSQLLKNHVRIHTGEKPYKCEFCDRCFRIKAHLTTHYITHTGEKKFVCQICCKAFASKRSLQSHMKCHLVCSDQERNNE